MHIVLAVTAAFCSHWEQCTFSRLITQPRNYNWLLPVQWWLEVPCTGRLLSEPLTVQCVQADAAIADTAQWLYLRKEISAQSSSLNLLELSSSLGFWWGVHSVGSPLVWDLHSVLLLSWHSHKSEKKKKSIKWSGRTRWMNAEGWHTPGAACWDQAEFLGNLLGTHTNHKQQK